MTIVAEDLFKLLVAVAIGGLIGLEREVRNKSAGFRTIILICSGATIFTIISMRIGGQSPDRIAANIVSGVGFLGAGAILRDAGQVVGLTTAAIIWLSAALGMGIGSGQYLLSAAGAVAAVIIMWVFSGFEAWIDRVREVHTYEIVCPIREGKFEQLDDLFRRSGLRVRSHRRLKRGDEMMCIWETGGSPTAHRRIADQLFADPDVTEIRY